MARPTITQQPVTSLHANPGDTRIFSIQAVGASSYLWYKAGAQLADGGIFSGTHTNALTLSGVQSGDAGGYYCVAQNGSGQTTPSSVGNLTVDDVHAPTINAQPADAVNVDPGTTVNLHVGADANGGQLAYRWSVSGIGGGSFIGNSADGSVTGATTDTLHFASVSSLNAAGYFCVVTNSAGQIISRTAQLTVKGQASTNPYEQVPTGAGGGVLGGAGGGNAGPVSGLFLSSYATGKGGSNGPAYIHSNLIGRLIPQAGAQPSKGEYGEDILAIPYKVARVAGWTSLIPPKNAALSDIPTMYYWDPRISGSTHGPVADLTLIFKGLLDDVLPDPIVENDETLGSVSVSTTDGGSLQYAFYAPRTIYRYMARADPKGVPRFTGVQNSESKPIRIYRSFITNVDHTQDDGNNANNGSDGSDIYQPLYASVEEICVSTRSVQCGAYYLCTDECQKTLVNPYSVG